MSDGRLANLRAALAVNLRIEGRDGTSRAGGGEVLVNCDRRAIPS